jgi:outer membrane protein OmpA-like peptidoglycan-associated protein
MQRDSRWRPSRNLGSRSHGLGRSFDSFSPRFQSRYCPSRNALIVSGALFVALILVGLGVFLGAGKPVPEYRLAWIAEKTTHAPSGIPDEVRHRVYDLSSTGAGTFRVYAAGSSSRPVASMDLAVTRDDAQETNGTLRTAALDKRLDGVEKKVADASVGRSGFSLFAALQAAVDESFRGNGRLEVWLSTTVFTGSVDPLKISQLTVADPRAAAEELLAGPLGALDLSHVDLHVVLLKPVGEDQEELNPASEEWRATFLRDLATGLRAQVSTPLHGTSTEPTWAGSSEVARIIPLPDPTPRTPQPPEQAVVPVVRIDTIAFVPDTATLRDPGAARAAVAGIAKEFAIGGRTGVIYVTGYCAAVGDPEGARRLSAQRAETIAELLQDVPRTAIRAVGRGFDERADPQSPPISAAQRVVVVRFSPSA